MISLVDFLWIEKTGMSIVSACFFTGVFASLAGVFWYFQRELIKVNERISMHSIRLDLTRDELTKMNTQLAVIKSTVEKMDKTLDRIVAKTYN